ncbi:hypothetical protein LTR10_017701 [Elasticomyces elasticus]|uniref:Fork-head domain-containing protein n=1 Tax=Exophiala sideris TaxID=1016849 RepID=A0ABR0JC71_9EURO|nr:hypothetical protein LTR10_017701 [Elasticomyces elasticus]KAK5031050.1 hypothetical protein LTS07_004785 [Exophiala sideris]KAK5038772.1 hypothetical protein LTR13_003803 [Exophiala sideris]KAK5060655.1 hypothetical protein LTR69_005254 [Exophiala sideris]KAK5183568.1 hypothetical protein LTR44_003850 [Eurotiomycetes sp. CCFEE 6388]
MKAEGLPDGYEPYDRLRDAELANLADTMPRALSHHSIQYSGPESHQSQLYPRHSSWDIHHALELEAAKEQTCNEFVPRLDHPALATTQIHFSDLELSPTWTTQEIYPQFFGNQHGAPMAISGPPLLQCPPSLVSPAFSTYQYYDDSDTMSAWSTTPEIPHCLPAMAIEEDDEPFDDKPYAMLIHEALKQAPGHRMMLRDIYDWFRQNTTKVQESGSNGWQNSIRHNLSMNKAFENDRDHSRGSSKKANSVWILTEDAIKNGVQSTTRYRKTGGGKRGLGHRVPAIQRQRSGARGGRAASRAARQRRQDNPYVTSTPLSGSPATPSYSDMSDYHSFDWELHPTVRNWTVPSLHNTAPLPDVMRQHTSISPQSSFDLSTENMNYSDEDWRLQSMLMRPLHGQTENELPLFHTE